MNLLIRGAESFRSTTMHMITNVVRKKAVWGPKRVFMAALALAIFAAPTVSAAAGPTAKKADRKVVRTSKFDRELQKRANERHGTTRVIIELTPGYEASAADLKRLGGVLGRKLGIINGQVADVPNSLLRWFENHPGFAKVTYDRPTAAENYRTAVTTGALAARQEFGYSGQGVGVAIVDSGITSWHNDLTGPGAYGNQRVVKFVDFVNGQTLPYDDNGHGTHIAGIIAGNGYNSFGQKAGMAPKASLVVLKVLDRDGRGTISNIIAALDWIVENKNTYNIRVANLSLGAGVYESYWTDPLTLAAKRAVDAGVVVCASAGNLGRNASGQTQYGAVTSPGNAPWVLTVGASSTMGTLSRVDDTMAQYSSRGPTYIDYHAKPDLVAPGTGTVSLSDPTSLFYATKAQYLALGSLPLGYKPYLALSGTSMAAPVVAGSVALMVQANPSLTPNAVKAILQYTSQVYADYDFLTQGAGFLNTQGAVRLSRFLATAQPGQAYPSKSVWAKHIIWGNHRLRGGYIKLQGANAWGSDVTWGNGHTDGGDNIVWGNNCDTSNCDNIVWGNEGGDNIVWGNHDDGDNIVWGNEGGDNIVWGNDCSGADCDNIVWGNTDDDNIVWGNAAGDDNIVWGNNGGDNIVWGNADALDVTVFSDEANEAEQGLTFDDLFGPGEPPPPPPPSPPAPPPPPPEPPQPPPAPEPPTMGGVF
jgi:serine protease AprX